jgi:hypothetical protein
MSGRPRPTGPVGSDAQGQPTRDAAAWMASARSAARLHIGRVEVRDIGQDGVSFPRQVEHLRARHRAAHKGRRDGISCRVRELDRLAKDGSRLGKRPGAETLERLGAQAVEARLLCEDVEGRKGEFVHPLREIRGERAARRHRTRIDPHDPLDAFGMAVEHETDGSVGPAVSDDRRRLVPGGVESSEGVDDRVGLVVEGPRGTPRVVSVETGQCDRDRPNAVGRQMFEDVVPRPRAQPVARNEEDGRSCFHGCHDSTFGCPMVRCMSLSLS